MKVKELIEHLKDRNQEGEVFVSVDPIQIDPEYGIRMFSDINEVGPNGIDTVLICYEGTFNHPVKTEVINV
jgi:hypothetical protein